jgi:hypothetical protein
MPITELVMMSVGEAVKFSLATFVIFRFVRQRESWLKLVSTLTSIA